jgi:hypothetical protein
MFGWTALENIFVQSLGLGVARGVSAIAHIDVSHYGIYLLICSEENKKNAGTEQQEWKTSSSARKKVGYHHFHFSAAAD